MSYESNQHLEKYIAHVVPDIDGIQYIEEHLKNVETLVEGNCPLPQLINVARLIAILHDIGKYDPDFQEYMSEVIKTKGEVHRHVDHSTAGGRLIQELVPNTLLAKIVRTAVYCHHGLQDSINIENGYSLEELRQRNNIDLDVICERYYHLYSTEEMKEYCAQAKQEVENLKQQIKDMVKVGGKERIYGSRDFFLGLYERMLLSILLDGDWTDAAAFNQHREITFRKKPEDMLDIWNTSLEHFEKYLCQMTEKKISNSQVSPLDKYRQEISDVCRDAALSSCRLYRLTVPTGAGKTLSSLRFALHHAKAYKKQHIIYVAPFNSILEQNASVIRNAVGNPDIVLEHHCNVIQENEKDEERYRQLTESWDSPIIVTTAVQVLNTLFSSSKMSLRRLLVLCNSVIIFDEVQAIPIRCTELFNLAVNFLTAFCNTTIVLCSATQPSLAKIPQNRIMEAEDMVGRTSVYSDVFKRTDIVDKTNLKMGGLEIQDLVEFVSDLLPKYNKILIIVNTKKCAKELYEQLKERYEGKPQNYIYHLSTNMCPVNRRDVLKTIKERLEKENNQDETVICVSTQMVEAGVDFSFQSVIRSMAGLDNIVQAAGRCNRNRETSRGSVYIVKMSPKAENLSKLKDIRDAQNAMEEVLNQFHADEGSFLYDISSFEAVTFFYQRFYYRKIGVETQYQVSIDGVQMTLIDLLSGNKKGWELHENSHIGKPGKESKLLNQAFKTAGDNFDVIPEDGKVEVVVSYKDEVNNILDELNNPYLSKSKQKRNMRLLQGYTVGISRYLKDQLGNAVSSVCGGKILVLNESYYDESTGVLDRPKMTSIFM